MLATSLVSSDWLPDRPPHLPPVTWCSGWVRQHHMHARSCACTATWMYLPGFRCWPTPADDMVALFWSLVRAHCPRSLWWGGLQLEPLVRDTKTNVPRQLHTNEEANLLAFAQVRRCLACRCRRACVPVPQPRPPSSPGKNGHPVLQSAPFCWGSAGRSFPETRVGHLWEASENEHCTHPGRCQGGGLRHCLCCCRGADAIM